MPPLRLIPAVLLVVGTVFVIGDDRRWWRWLLGCVFAAGILILEGHRWYCEGPNDSDNRQYLQHALALESKGAQLQTVQLSAQRMNQAALCLISFCTVPVLRPSSTAICLIELPWSRRM